MRKREYTVTKPLIIHCVRKGGAKKDVDVISFHQKGFISLEIMGL
jgi:hypothetical protein